LSAARQRRRWSTAVRQAPRRVGHHSAASARTAMLIGSSQLTLEIEARACHRPACNPCVSRSYAVILETKTVSSRTEQRLLHATQVIDTRLPDGHSD